MYSNTYQICLRVLSLFILEHYILSGSHRRTMFEFKTIVLWQKAEQAEQNHVLIEADIFQHIV